MAMKPDIHAGSTIANAIAHNANATANTMLANSQMLGNNLSNIFETMNRNRALREQEEQRKLDNAYRENTFNYQKAADERNYNYQKERDLAKDNQWQQEMGLKRQQIAQGWGHADLYKQQAEALRFQNERDRQLYSDDIPMFDTAPTPQPTPPSQPSEFLTKEEAQQQQAPQSYLGAVWEINQRNAQAQSSKPLTYTYFNYLDEKNAKAQALPQAHPQAPQQPSFLAQHRTQQDNGIPKMMAAVTNQKGQIKQPQIVMRSNNQYGNKEAELRKRLQERTAYLQELKGSK